MTTPCSKLDPVFTQMSLNTQGAICPCCGGQDTVTCLNMPEQLSVPLVVPMFCTKCESIWDISLSMTNILPV